MKIMIHGLTKLNAAEKNKIIRSLKKGEAVIDSPVWFNAISGLRFTGTSKTGTEIAKMIRSGEDYKPYGKDGVIDIEIEGFYKNSSTVGYTYLNRLKTYINRKFLRQFTEDEVFGHIMHELMHRMGFSHDSSTDKKSDVAYLVGYASRDAFEEYYSMPRPFTVSCSGPSISFEY